MQIEEDLGYTIPAENLAIFSKVRHYINYIEHVEMFKKKYNKSPEA
jgi:acyl carrier protein